MSRKNRKRGFTMAELLIVVAIIGVLGAVTFVAVNQHQRSLERLERDSVAREIFVAAQNHLTMAQSQGYLGMGDEKGEIEDADKGIYFFVVNQGDAFSSAPSTGSVLDLMLPYGAIDETVRGGGSYIIRYNYDTGTVMDVFYCSNPSVDTRFGCNLSAGDEEELVSNWRDGKESARKNYSNGKVLGWYGGADGESLKPDPDKELEAPLIVVENSDKLRVGIVDKNKTLGGSLQLAITSTLDSAIIKIVDLKIDKTIQSPDRLDSTNKNVNGVDCDYVIVLDDITTADMRFAALKGVKNGIETFFTPGEDIVLQAVAFDNTRISNIAYSAQITVNSLYEKLDVDASTETMTASISSIRHLENLDRSVSKVGDSRTVKANGSDVSCILKKAIQTSDLKWKDFMDHTNGTIQLYGTNTVPKDEKTSTTGEGYYLPVVPYNPLTYEGGGHSVYDINVNYAGNSGMFGELKSDSSISDLQLIDFSITATSGNAGALVGTLTQSKALPKDDDGKDIPNVSNVVVYNDLSATTVQAANTTAGNAGGLAGTVNGGFAAIEKSAASLVVSSAGGNAGGLIGETNGGNVSGCYSGGHTNKGSYFNDDETEIYNIQAQAGNAGGLIGVATSTPIEYCYSTCSVTGKIAGGFVASASSTIKSCYATGMVKGTDTETVGDKTIPKDGAFAYSVPVASNSVSDCYYFEIINGREDAEAGYTYLTALGKEGKNSSIKPLDADYVDDLTLNTYNNVFANPENWTEASPYDAKLIEYYGGKYNLLNVVKLGATDDGTTDYFVSTHHGDWPAPEVFVVNTANSGS